MSTAWKAGYMTQSAGATDPPEAPEIKPGTLAWRIVIATTAYRFFGVVHHTEAAKLIDQPQDAGKTGAWPVAYFSLYLQKSGFPGGTLSEIARIFADMERLGLLLCAGWRTDLNGAPLQGKLYVSAGVQSVQTAGHLWLSEAFGAELIIDAYRLPTLLISGGEGKPVGTGLVVDRTHVVTNRHVIEGLAGPSEMGVNIEVYPSSDALAAERITRQARIIGHPDVDVTVIEADFADNEGLVPLDGTAFRDPRWHDDVYVFGYPYVPGLTERPVTVERGHIVHPSAEAAAMAGYPRQTTFLTSAIARPGNSGGPIVAQDGRVIGLVAESAREVLSTTGDVDASSPDAPPFYRGIPGGEVVRAIEHLGFTDIAALETV